MKAHSARVYKEMGVPELSNCPDGNRQCLLLFISFSIVYALLMKHLTLRRKKKKDWKKTLNRSLRFQWMPALEWKMSSFQAFLKILLFAKVGRNIQDFRKADGDTGWKALWSAQGTLLGLWWKLLDLIGTVRRKGTQTLRPLDWGRRTLCA